MTEKLVKLNGVWRLFSGNERRHLCDVCKTMSYTWKEFDIHKKTHTFEELDKVLWAAVDAKMAWDLDRNCPT